MAKRGRIGLGGLPLIFLGAVLFLSGAGLTGRNLQEDRQAGAAAQKTVEALVEYLPEETLHPTPLPDSEEAIAVIDNRVLPVQTVDGRDYVGIIKIPSLSLELPVQTPFDLASLKISPCLYAGDPYHSNMVICAHNYRSHFGRIKNLEQGDELFFVAMDGEWFQYRVISQEIVDPLAYDEMLEPAGWDLTLFTCTVSGEYRVAVRCARVDPKKATPSRTGVAFSNNPLMQLAIHCVP